MLCMKSWVGKILLRNTVFLVKKLKKILCCKQELFLLVFANGEIYSNIHSRSDDLDFLQRTIYDMS